MTNSMTAYAQAKIAIELGELSCELRSVNLRYLEIAPRMPEELRVHEGVLREMLGARLARGHVDCFIRLKESASIGLKPNIELADNLESLMGELKNHIPSMQALRAIDVLRWPDMLQTSKADPEELKQAFITMLAEALDGLVDSRAQEGSKMAELMVERLDGIRAVITEVGDFLPDMVDQYRTRLEEKIVAIKDQLDPSRLEQEMVMFLQKTDVAEELDRLTVHVDEVATILTKDEPAGRRLDFLMQELNREANTLGSKSQDPRLTKASVDLKVLIEQMREQVQNIE